MAHVRSAGAHSIFEEESRACHLALGELRGLMLRIGFVVERKRETEATLRVYVRERLTYPLLNPRFVRRRVSGLKGTAFLQMTVLSKGHENLEQRLPHFQSTPVLAFRDVGEWQSSYFVHGHFFSPLPVVKGALGDTGLAPLEQPLRDLLRYLT